MNFSPPLGAALLATAIAGPLTACAARTVGEPLSFYRGKTLDNVAAVVDEGFLYAVQDDSVLVGAEPRFDEAQWGASAWTVLAVCADAETLEESSRAELIVVPTAGLNPAERRAIESGTFHDQQPSCDMHSSAEPS